MIQRNTVDQRYVIVTALTHPDRRTTRLMPPTPPLRPPVARFLATSSAWLTDDSADVRRIDEGDRVAGRCDAGHSEVMGERELIAHRRRLRALWIAQWQASLQAKLGVASGPHGVAAATAERAPPAGETRQLARHAE